MKRTIGIGLLCVAVIACSQNKNLAQTNSMNASDTLVKHINSSTGDTDIINPHLKKLQQQNDLVIAFGTLNFAWARKGTFYVLASHNNAWKLYGYVTRLPASAEDETATLTPQNVSAVVAEKIKKMYASSKLWKTGGDNGDNFCSDKKDCNINDAETWTISVATPQHIHTTTYYAPEFFEQCCPDPYRKLFIDIGKEMMKLSPGNSAAPDR